MSSQLAMSIAGSATLRLNVRRAAARFVENSKLFADGCPREVIEAGPTRIR
jgi:hypothetical protein